MNSTKYETGSNYSKKIRFIKIRVEKSSGNMVSYTVGVMEKYVSVHKAEAKEGGYNRTASV